MLLLASLWIACTPFSAESGLRGGDAAALASGQVCVDVEPERASCSHSFGGEYADGACSAGYQCCDGAWGARETCGACACTEPTGQVGCAPEPAGASCTHSFGGQYGDGACSSGYQCCDGAWATRGSCGDCDCVEPSGEQGCGELGSTECSPRFVGRTDPLPADLRAQMTGTTWSPGCPVSLDDLALITASHWDFDGEPATGRIVVRADVAHVVLEVLRVAWDTGYPIERMEPASTYGGNDDASMAANNTSAFNCRAITGGSAWSQHSYGDAVDLNPLVNPYVSGSTVLPPGGSAYLDRDPADPGVLVGSSAVTQAFLLHGWRWGGYWSTRKDYQHFSANGR
ncbi:MAG: M15 family metallopeptidase [Myxococcota bacterium]